MSLTTYLLGAGWNRNPRKNDLRPEGRRRATPKVENLEQLCLLSASGLATGGGDNGHGGHDQYAYVSGQKFEDLTANGKENKKDPGLKGWTIEAFVDNGDGKLSKDEYQNGPADKVSTDYYGNYKLKLKEGDDYIIVEKLKDKWYQSYPKTDVLKKFDSDDLGEKGYAIKDLEKDVYGKDFGNYQYADLSGYKFNDKDRDGYFDHNEQGLKGWKIEAFVDQNGDGKLDKYEYQKGSAATDYTDKNGYYSLHVKPGDYILVEVQQEGWDQSKVDHQVKVNSDSLGKYGYAESVTSGQKVYNLDFGNFQKHKGDHA